MCRDPDDDQLLALASAAKVDLVVSGDDDLLVLGMFEGIAIVSPARTISLINAIGRKLTPGRQRVAPSMLANEVTRCFRCRIAKLLQEAGPNPSQ